MVNIGDIFAGGVSVDEVAVFGVVGAKDGVLVYQLGQSGVKDLRVFGNGAVQVELKEGTKYISGLPTMVTRFSKKGK